MYCGVQENLNIIELHIIVYYINMYRIPYVVWPIVLACIKFPYGLTHLLYPLRVALNILTIYIYKDCHSSLWHNLLENMYLLYYSLKYI